MLQISKGSAAQQAVIIKSQFSQIKRKQDYLKVMENINMIAETNGTELPDFNVW